MLISVLTSTYLESKIALFLFWLGLQGRSGAGQPLTGRLFSTISYQESSFPVEMRSRRSVEIIPSNKINWLDGKLGLSWAKHSQNWDRNWIYQIQILLHKIDEQEYLYLLRGALNKMSQKAEKVSAGDQKVHNLKCGLFYKRGVGHIFIFSPNVNAQFRYFSLRKNKLVLKWFLGNFKCFKLMFHIWGGVPKIKSFPNFKFFPN